MTTINNDVIFSRLDRIEAMLQQLLDRHATQPVSFVELKTKLASAPPEEQLQLIQAWNRRQKKHATR